MDNEEIESFHAYSGAGDQRNIAGEAAKFELWDYCTLLNLRLMILIQVHKIMAQPEIAIHSYSSYKH
jgi:hypothetical protein